MSSLLYKTEMGLTRVQGNRFWLSRRKHFQIIRAAQWERLFHLNCELPVTENSQAKAWWASVWNSEGFRHWMRAWGRWPFKITPNSHSLWFEWAWRPRSLMTCQSHFFSAWLWFWPAVWPSAEKWTISPSSFLIYKSRELDLMMSAFSPAHVSPEASS